MEYHHSTFKIPNYKSIETNEKIKTNSQISNNASSAKIHNTKHNNDSYYHSLNPLKPKCNADTKKFHERCMSNNSNVITALSPTHDILNNDVKNHSSSQLLIELFITFPDVNIKTYSMIDSGATGCFINTAFVKKFNVPIRPKALPMDIHVIDGRSISSGPINHETLPIRISISQHSETIVFNVTDIGSFDCILGMDWLTRHNPQINWNSKMATFVCCGYSQAISVSLISAHVFSSPYPEITQDLSIFSAASEEIEHVPSDYLQYADIFSKSRSNSLPPHRPCDHKINVEEPAIIPHGPIYNLSELELQCLRTYINDNLSNGFIRPSTSPYSSPILFVKKKDNTLRLCVDYRKLNSITIKNRYPLPLISELLDRLKNAKYFTKLDLRNGYNLIRIAAGDEHKTAFRCRYGHFEYCVMPFGLTNAPATFQNFINDIFRNELDYFVVAYLDDILIYSNDLTNHIQHVSKVLAILKNNHLYVKPEKCVFHASTVDYLGFRISSSGVEISPNNVAAIKTWPSPRSIKDVQSFLGFCNFYRRFIKNYSTIAAPLTNLLKKNATFSWGNEHIAVFKFFIDFFSSPPLLCHFDANKETILECDASDFALGSVLSQKQADNQIRPIAYYSRKFTTAEANYDVYNKELLSIVAAIQNWRYYLEGISFRIITDHKNLVYFKNATSFNRRQARWAELLSSYDFTIEFTKGSSNVKADALSRRRDYVFDGEHEESMQQKRIFDNNHFISSLTLSSSLPKFTILPADISKGLPPNDSIFHTIRSYQNEDELVKLFHSFKKDNVSIPKKFRKYFKHLSLKHDVLFYGSAIYTTPNENLINSILNELHDSPLAGHFGHAKTYQAFSKRFWFPSMKEYIYRYVKSCIECQRNKVYPQKPLGELCPLPIPTRPWESVGMDLITKLPISDSYDSILTVIDRFSKMVHFIPCSESSTSMDLAKIYLNHVFKLHGLPKSIISDRGPIFVSKFWTELLKLLSVKSIKSSAYHPQTDGQTERANGVVETYLRFFMNDNQDNWARLLPLAEFAINNSIHTSTKLSPFYANYGFDPFFSPLLELPSDSPSASFNVALMKKIYEQLRSNLLEAQNSMIKFHNIKRKLTPPFSVDDLVWLSSKHIKLKIPSRKLGPKKCGPFRISQVINNVAYRLDLPPEWRIYNVFHISLLEKYFPSRRKPEDYPKAFPPADSEYEVSAIIDSRLRNGKVEYLLDWHNYGPEDRSWTVLDNPILFTDLLTNFHTNYPDKPIDNRFKLAGVSSL